MIKYKAELYYKPTITKVNVIKQTECQVVLENRREAKNCDNYVYVDTFNDAKNWLLDKYKKKEVEAKIKIKRLNDDINEYKEERSIIFKLKEEQLCLQRHVL